MPRLQTYKSQQTSPGVLRLTCFWESLISLLCCLNLCPNFVCKLCMLSLELTLPVMDQTMRFIEQSIGNVRLGDNSNANIGIFNNSNLEQPNSLQALFSKEMRNQLHAISEPSHNTCSWIFDEIVFQNFWNTRCGLLWVKGRPGAGKSTIMKYAMSRLMPVAGSNSRAVAAFFCHARGVELQRTQSGVF